ncbi:LysR family transcriptional regulator [Motiliproteus sp. SC1-56]|uniref:LysR family transcriptional regulator n=1 Tax=Motiliproteus sp. SC1-56 TaxID=2799565 RepID=UPI001A8D9C1C|nr:LysR family transcriptional regulator [Motiliproteus sp. SC1-56]
MKYSLRQLEVFVEAAQQENITRAAEKLAMSQSAASGALRELESQFEVQLFDRVGKRLQLNELGRLIRPRAEALLAQAQELERALRRHADIGHLNLGATLSIGNYLAVDIMARFMEENPDAEVDLAVANTRDIVAGVVGFELDVGLIEGEVTHPQLEVLPWRADELVVVAPPGHPLAACQKVTDEQLTTCRWLLREPGSGTRQAFERAMQGLLPKLEVRMELQHTEAIKHAVESGFGLSCLSRICVADELARGELVALAVPHRDFTRQLYLILHRKKYRSEGILRWLELCQSDYGT